MTTTQPPLQLDLPNDDRFMPSIIREFLKDGQRQELISLAGGLPARELIPAGQIGAALQRVVANKGSSAFQYGESAGEPDFLRVLAQHLHVDPSRLLVTAGSQQALSLCLAALDPGPSSGQPATAAIEDPGYLGALQLLRAHRYQPLSIPVDGDGMRVDVLAERLEAGQRITVCYVNPNFQNPTGAVLSRARADALLDLAERYRFAVIADDPYRELYLDSDSAPEPFRSSPSLINLGSFSKTLAPGLRLGWLEADASLVVRAERAKQSADLHTNSLAQLAAADLLTHGSSTDSRWWPSHLAALRAGYRHRRDALVEALANQLPGAAVHRPRGGFFCWVELPARPDGQPIDGAELLSRTLRGASGRPVGFVPGSAFSASGGQHNYIRLSYSHADPQQFDQAMACLAAAL